MKKVENAINSGINYFDTSPYYGALKSETVLGKSLKGISREKFYVSTKCGRYGVENGTAVDSKFDFSAKTVTESVKSSLTRMSLDYFDIVYVHDIEFAKDLRQITKETIPALLKLKAEGYLNHIGISGFPLKTLDEVIIEAESCIDVVLSYGHYTLQSNLLDGFAPKWRHKGLGVVNASPFSMGLFTDKGPPSWHPAGEELKTAAKKVHSLCDEKKKNISKLALCKCLSGENADTVLTGINSMKDLCEALECVGKRYESFDRDLVNGVDEILRGVFNKMW